MKPALKACTDCSKPCSDGNSQTVELQAGCLLLIIFTALHATQTRSSAENSVCLSVRLSVRHTRVL